MSRLMSAAEAEKWLGMRPSVDGRALLRIAMARETETGKRFLLRRGSEQRRRYLFTEQGIRRHLPELWQGHYERTTKAALETIERVRGHIDERIDERIAGHPVVQELDARTISTIEVVSRLAREVERIARTDPNRRQPTAHRIRGRSQDSQAAGGTP